MRQEAEKQRLPALDLLRSAREISISLAADLDQSQLDARPDPDRWSVGEILDHLSKVDRMFLREVNLLVEKRRQGRPPFVYRGLRELGAPGGSLPLPFRLPIEGTLAFWNVALPSRLRELAIRQRVVRATAPKILEPSAGRGRDELFADLRAGIEEVERLEASPGLDLHCTFYYSPLAGLNGIDGLVRLIAQHDLRHHGQLREAREALTADSPSSEAEHAVSSPAHPMEVAR